MRIFTATAIGNTLSPLSSIESLEIDSMQSGSKMKLSIQVSTARVRFDEEPRTERGNICFSSML
jgi:hypothetical protein